MTNEEKVQIALGMLLILDVIVVWSVLLKRAHGKRESLELHYEPLDDPKK